MSQYGYATVAASQTAQVLHASAGTYLHRLICTVSAAATSTVSITDGAGAAIPISAVNTPIGVYIVDVEAYNTHADGWEVTTAAGVTVLAIGRFLANA